jgi:WD40 repeat protein
VSCDTTVRLWDVTTGKELFQGLHEGRVEHVFFTADGSALITGCHDLTVRWWDAATGKELRRLPVRGSAKWLALAQSPDRNVLLGSALSEEALHLWDAGTGKEICRLEQQPSDFLRVHVAAGGNILVSTGFDTPRIRLWDLQTGKVRHTLGPDDDPRQDRPAVAVSPDGRTVAAEMEAGRVNLWEVETGQDRGVLRLDSGPIRSLAFSPDGRVLAAAELGGTVRFWSLAEKKELGRLEAGVLSHAAGCALAFSPDGRRLATVQADTTVLIWDWRSALRDQGRPPPPK